MGSAAQLWELHDTLAHRSQIAVRVCLVPTGHHLCLPVSGHDLSAFMLGIKPPCLVQEDLLGRELRLSHRTESLLVVSCAVHGLWPVRNRLAHFLNFNQRTLLFLVFLFKCARLAIFRAHWRQPTVVHQVDGVGLHRCHVTLGHLLLLRRRVIGAELDAGRPAFVE